MCALLVGLVLYSAKVAAAQTGSELHGRALVEMLRQGGFNIYFRHAATDWSQADQVSKADDWTSCDPARMRQLSDTGRQIASTIGEAMRVLHIPVGHVFASPYCRTVETARLMQLGEVETASSPGEGRSISLRVDLQEGMEVMVALSLLKRMSNFFL